MMTPGQAWGRLVVALSPKGLIMRCTNPGCTSGVVSDGAGGLIHVPIMGDRVCEQATTSALPFMGGMVHYVGRTMRGGRFRFTCHAAFITEIADELDRVGLMVAGPNGLIFLPLVSGGVVLGGQDREVGAIGAVCPSTGGIYPSATWHSPGRS